MTVDYIKTLVVELDPYCESQVIYDANCKPSEIEKYTKDLREKYPGENVYLIIMVNQTMTINKK